MSRDDDLAVVVVAVIVAAIVGVLIWLSRSLNVDLNTAGSVFIRLTVVAAIWTFVRVGIQVRFGETWPLLFATIWMAFWPVLNYWSEHREEIHSYSGLMPVYELTPAFYATDLFQLGCFVGIVVAGYGLRRLLNYY